MSDQYLRVCSVSVEGGGKTIGLEKLDGQNDRQLRVRFDVTQQDLSTPHVCNCYIYNLKRETIQALMKEGKILTLKAGYDGGAGILFKGEIKQVRTSRENVVDTVTHILAAAAERARNLTVVSKSLSAGHTFKDRIDVATKAMQQFGITIGHIDDLGSKKFARGFVAHGMAKNLLRDICFATGSSWHNHNGVFNLVKNQNTLPGDTIVLNSQTGMIGLPEQTLQGVIVRCLLNYRIRPAQKIKINESSIQQAALNPSYTGAVSNELLQGQLGLAADGIYKALLVDHNGDTRGPNWYTEIICVKNDGGASPALIQRGIKQTESD